MLPQSSYEERFRENWTRFCNRYKVTASQREPILKELLERYGEPHRRYHGIKHPVLLFEALKDIRLSKYEWFKSEEWNATLELAIWDHDLFYDATSEMNEELSAARAVEHARGLGFSEKMGNRARRLILATKHQHTPAALDEQIMVDIDLSLLADPWVMFKRSSQDIREEYSHYSDEQFKVGRRKFLEGMLPPKRARIFSTDYFYENLEALARNNIERSLKEQFALQSA